MKTRRIFTRKSPTVQTTPLKPKHSEYAFPTDTDLIVLCSFRADLDGEQTYDQLRGVLLAEGFRAPHASYVIRSSRLLHRVSRNRYCLRGYQP